MHSNHRGRGKPKKLGLHLNSKKSIPSPRNQANLDLTPAQLSNTDCYFYYYSSCSKGPRCPYRHEPAALGNETICEYWIKGLCVATTCKYRHMKISKQRNKIACFHESQPGGCQKSHCPFLHNDDQNLNQDSRPESDQLYLHMAATKDSCQSGQKQFGIQRGAVSSFDLSAIKQDLPKSKRRISGHSLSDDENVTTKWANNLLGEVPIPQICFSSVESLCPREESGCSRLHCSNHFYWQIKKPESFWMNLPMEQVLALEENYCDPHVTSFDLPVLDSSSIDSSSKPLLLTMNGRSKWVVDFDRMLLTMRAEDQSVLYLSLRRLCSESVQHKSVPACTFLWYYLDKNRKWTEYGQGDSTGSSPCQTSSAAIEKHFLKNRNIPLIVKSSAFNYKLDFTKMIQTNEESGKTRPMLQRPKPHLQNKRRSSSMSEYLPTYWDPMNPGVKLIRVPLAASSTEYKNLLSFIKNSGGTFNVVKIERVQNQFLYYAYLNKLKDLKNVYSRDSDLNVKQLFHGTNPDIVNAICDQNFDWRLHGSSSGQSYGRGTYFATSAAYSHHYSKADRMGNRHMFIAKVVVGSLVAGNSSMVRPPINPQTNALYDSSCDTPINPKIIVKYDTQEYFPEYIVTIR